MAAALFAAWVSGALGTMALVARQDGEAWKLTAAYAVLLAANAVWLATNS